MMNYIWFALMAIAVVVAAFKGTAADVTKGAVDSARTAVEWSPSSSFSVPPTRRVAKE